MLKKWISSASMAIAFTFSSFTQIATANNLPDFTELAEKHGAEVVNISVTQVMQAGNSMPFPNMPDDPALQEFFKHLIFFLKYCLIKTDYCLLRCQP